MDPLTHTLTGLMMSRAGLSRLHERAPLALMLSANAPDIDGLSLLGGIVPYIQYHRSLPHSILFVPLVAALTVVLIGAFRRSFEGWGRLYLLCLAGVASHLLLDWTNTYGVRFLLPFSSAWFHLDLNGLLDPWIFAVLLIAWLMVYIFRLVNAEIGAKPGSGRGLAIFALVFFVGFDYGKFLLHQRAITMLNSRIYDGSAPARVAAFPVRSNPVEWQGWVETPTFFRQYTVNVMSDFDPSAGTTFFKPDTPAAIAAARATPVFQNFLDFDQYPRWSVTPVPEPEGGNRVELHDLRLPFHAIAIENRENRVLKSWLEF
jgi:inner membrane protein